MALTEMTFPDGFAARLFVEMAELRGVPAITSEQDFGRVVVFDRDHPMNEPLKKDYVRHLETLGKIGLSAVNELVDEYKEELRRREAGLDATVNMN